jgi:hypothetical protein
MVALPALAPNEVAVAVEDDVVLVAVFVLALGLVLAAGPSVTILFALGFGIADYFAVAYLAAPSSDVVRVRDHLAHDVTAEMLQLETDPSPLRSPEIADVLDLAPWVVLEID